MIWITIIFELISALPTIIKLIEDIINAIHGGNLTLGQKLHHENALQNVLYTWFVDRDHAALQTNLGVLAGKLGLP